MNVLDKNWLLSEPIDYELKKYRLLSALKKIGSLIKDDDLYDVLLEIEDHLEDLYKYKYEKNILDDRLKVLKGIDIDNMSLLYEYPENSDQLQVIDVLCDESIELLEKLYKFLREKWRINSKFIAYTSIPTKKLLWDNAVLYVINHDKIVTVYNFNRPSRLDDDWKKLNFEFVKEFPYELSTLSENVSSISVLNPKTQCIRADVKKDLPFENCLIPIIKYNIFNSIKKGDI
jgi:hypothetical protein